MTLLTVSTVKGAPGGTTLAFLLAQALAAPSYGTGPCLFLECDPAGGDLAPALGLLAIPGLASLALAARHGLTADVLISHTQSPAGSPGLQVVPGVAGPEQGGAVRWLLDELARILADPSIRAIADLGRLQHDDANDSLRSAAAANLIVTGDDVASLLHTRSAVDTARRAGLALDVVVSGQRSHGLVQVARATEATVIGTVRRDPMALAILLRSDRRLAGFPRTTASRRRTEGLKGDVTAILHSLETRGALVPGPVPAAPPVGTRGRAALAALRTSRARASREAQEAVLVG